MTTGGRPYLSIVIPSHNEEERLGRSLPSIGDYLKQQGLDAEIVVVDDGSSDATARIAGGWLKGQRGRVLRHPENRGKGYAVRRGVVEAQGRWILLTDASLSVPIDEHAKLAAAVRAHDVDVAIGSRALPDSAISAPGRIGRGFRGRTLDQIMLWMTGLRFRDPHCGFKLLDRERTRPLFERMRADRFAFDVELLFLCVRFGLRVSEVPIVWRDTPKSKARVGDSLRMLLDVAAIRWRFRRGLYNPAPSPQIGGSDGE